MRTLFIIVAIFLAVSCSYEKLDIPKGIITPEKMQPLIYDLIKADEYIANYTTHDSTLNKRVETVKLYEQVFRLHKVTKDEFYKSYTYYQEHPDLNKQIFDSLYNYTSRLKHDSVPRVPPGSKGQ